MDQEENKWDRGGEREREREREGDMDHVRGLDTTGARILQDACTHIYI